MNILVSQGPLALFAAFVVAHALCDFPLQGAYLSKQKVRKLADGWAEWFVALSAHCVIHAGAVWLVSGSLLLGVVELVLHGLIDTGKSEDKFGLIADQSLHLICKVGYVVLLLGHGPL